MPFLTNKKQEITAVTPCRTMRGHTDNVKGLVHLPGGRRIITCSLDGSLRLWNLESGAQIGEDWRDEVEKTAAVYKMALSPSGQTVVSGSGNGKMKLWDVETGQVIQRWAGHTEKVLSVCWSVDGNRIGSGSWDGMARVWDVKTGERILAIQTEHEYLWAVLYSPDKMQIATGGSNEHAAKIWDANTGELLTTLKHDYFVQSLVWTSDGKKLISASYGPMRIFDTATWRQVAILGGHTNYVNAITLSWNNRLLASASDDNTVRLWSLDTNLPVGPPLQHKDKVECAVFSADGRVLVTGSRDKNAYAWDIHAILKTAGFEDLLTDTGNVSANISPTLPQ
jgi:WD40 repeat protein